MEVEAARHGFNKHREVSRTTETFFTFAVAASFQSFFYFVNE